MRSVLRWLRRLVLGALALAVVVTAMVLIVAHTDWGREVVRREVEAALRDAFPGGARIGRLDGSILGTLTLRDLELDGRDHRPQLTVGTLDVAIALWPLVLGTAHIDRVIADDVHVLVRDQPPAPAARPAASEAAAWQVELPWIALHRVVVEVAAGARVTLGDVELAGAGTVGPGGVAMFGWLQGQWRERAVGFSAAASVVIDGGVRVPAAMIRIGDAAIGATGVVIDAGAPRGVIAVRAPAATLRALVPTLARYVPARANDPADPIDPIVATVEISAPRPASEATPATTQLDLHATAGATRLWAALRGDLATRVVHGVVSIDRVDLAVATQQQLCGHAAVLVALDGTAPPFGGAAGRGQAPTVDGTAPPFGGAAGRGQAPTVDGTAPPFVDGGADHLRGTWIVHGDPGVAAASGACTAGSLAVRDAVVALDATRDHVTALVLGGGDGGLAAFASAAAQHVGAAWVVDGVLHGRGIDLAAGPGRLRVAAARVPFVVTARAGATIDVVVHEAHATTVRYAELAAAELTASLSARVAPEILLDQAQVTVTGVRRGTTLLGAAHLAARGVGGRGSIDGRGLPPTGSAAEWRRGSIAVAVTAWPATRGLIVATDAHVDVRGVPRVQLGTTQLTLPNRAIWTGRGGALVVGDVVRLRDLVLSRGEATVALGGAFTPRTGALAVHVAVDGLAAAQLDPALRGRGRGVIELARRGGAWRADARLEVTDVALGPEAAGIDGSAHVTLDGSHVTLDAHTASAALGGLALALDVTAPRDPFDLAAWQALDRSAIHRAEVRAERFHLDSLAGLAPPDPVTAEPSALAALTGTLDGAVDLAPGALAGALAVRDVALPFGTLAADATFERRDGELGARATARLSDLAALDLTARFAIPQQPFAPATWTRRGRDLLRDASGTLAGVTFDPVLLGKLGITRRLAAHGIAWPLRGRADAKLELSAGASAAQIAIDVSDVTGGPLAAPISQHLTITADPSGTHGRWALASRDLALGTLEVELPMPLDRWIDDPAAVRSEPLTGRWSLPVTPIASILALADRRDLVAGTLEGSAAITGTLASPIVAPARLVARDLVVAAPLGGKSPPALQALELTARWDGARLALAVDGREASGGNLHAELAGPPGALAEATGSLVARQLDLAPIAALVHRAMVPTAGVLDADLALHTGERLGGTLALTRGVVPISSSVGTLRDTTAKIQIDDRGATATVDGALGGGKLHLDAGGDPALGAIDVHALRLDQVTLSTALRPRITATVTAKLQRALTQITGQITVARATVTLPEHAGTPLLDATMPDDLILPGAEPPAATGAGPPMRPWLKVGLALGRTTISAPQLADGVDFEGTVHSEGLDLALGDTAGVSGTVTVDDADVTILGRHYLVNSSDLRFDGTTDPRLDLHLSYAFPSMTLLVNVGGLASRPEPSFSSEPGGYSRDQLFGFFLGGEPGGDPGTQTREAVTGAGALVVSSKLGRQLNKVLPIKVDALSCEPSTTATSASCTVGKWLSQRLFLAYRQHLAPRGDESSRDAQVQIRMGRKVLIEGTAGEGERYGADLLWRHRW
jgi:TamB, inner membrane protein subunit of TAM complex